MYIRYFVGVFYLIQIWRFFSHDLLSQMVPRTRLLTYDVPSLALASTSIPEYLILHPRAFVWIDVIYFILPLLCYVLYIRRVSGVFMVPALFFFYFHSVLLAQFPTVSLEGTIDVQLIPFMFLVRRDQDVSLMSGALRYVMCIVMMAAGFWKFYTGAVMVPEQMSRILMDHNMYYMQYGTGWEYALGGFLIERPFLAQSLYVAAALLELSFVIGFFTKKYDRVLLIFLASFVLLDLVVMRIPYFPFLSFLIFFIPYKKGNAST